jgi:hypothetical protein
MQLKNWPPTKARILEWSLAAVLLYVSQETHFWMTHVTTAEDFPFGSFWREIVFAGGIAAILLGFRLQLLWKTRSSNTANSSVESKWPIVTGPKGEVNIWKYFWQGWCGGGILATQVMVWLWVAYRDKRIGFEIATFLIATLAPFIAITFWIKKPKPKSNQDTTFLRG